MQPGVRGRPMAPKFLSDFSGAQSGAPKKINNIRRLVAFFVLPRLCITTR
jgi:hypothetical protein